MMTAEAHPEALRFLRLDPETDPTTLVARLVARHHEFRSVFQPILSLRDSRVIGYEALLRLPVGSGFAGAAEAFAAAAATDLLVDLEVAALEAHLRSARGLADARLFVNLSARAFRDARMRSARLADLARAAGFAPTSMVLELTELVWIDDMARLGEAIASLRTAGFLLAVDDFGAGFSNIQSLVELGPDFLKIDRSLVSGAAGHPRRRVFLESMGILGRRINCSVIAEGTETEEDLSTLRACGIECAQGWAIARPQPFEELSRAPIARRPVQESLPEECIGAFSLPEDGVSPATPVGRLVQVFDQRSQLTALPVLEGPRAIGLVTRNTLFQHLGHRYGFALWNDRRVIDFLASLGQGFDRLSAGATADEAVELVRRRPASRRFDPLVVENELNAYHGLLPVDSLLAEVSRLKIEYALESNPLTGLPGSLVLARVVESRLRGHDPFALGWVDIDYFKPFNDHYGFPRGDEVLLLLSELLRTRAGRAPTRFLAHPGGDDFAVLTAPEEAAGLGQAVALEFADRVLSLYDPADRRRGGITSVDRQGVPRHFGFLTLSIGIVAWQGELGMTYRRLVEIAAEMKGAAKRVPGTAVFANQRALQAAGHGQPAQ